VVVVPESALDESLDRDLLFPAPRLGGPALAHLSPGRFRDVLLGFFRFVAVGKGRGLHGPVDSGRPRILLILVVLVLRGLLRGLACASRAP